MSCATRIPMKSAIGGLKSRVKHKIATPTNTICPNPSDVDVLINQIL